MPTATKPTRDWSTFLWYYTSPNGVWTKYYEDTMASARTWNLTANTILYAKWSCPNGALEVSWEAGIIYNDVDKIITLRDWNWCGYIIQDRNLWATAAYNWESESTTNTIGSSPFYWNYYQFWRNTAAWTNWSEDYYYDWKSPGWIDKWSANNWWVTDTNALTATYSNSTSANKTKMKWPCDNWRHVPTSLEWDWLVKAWFTYRWVSCSASVWNSCSLSWNATLANFKSDLKLPLAGRRARDDGSVFSQGDYGWYWSSSPTNTYARSLLFRYVYVQPHANAGRGYGFSVRCFKNEN
jgi:hypothetical protein